MFFFNKCQLDQFREEDLVQDSVLDLIKAINQVIDDLGQKKLEIRDQEFKDLGQDPNKALNLSRWVTNKSLKPQLKKCSIDMETHCKRICAQDLKRNLRLMRQTTAFVPLLGVRTLEETASSASDLQAKDQQVALVEDDPWATLTWARNINKIRSTSTRISPTMDLLQEPTWFNPNKKEESAWEKDFEYKLSLLN